MVTSPYEWKKLECYENPQTNKHTQMNKNTQNIFQTTTGNVLTRLVIAMHQNVSVNIKRQMIDSSYMVYFCIRPVVDLSMIDNNCQTLSWDSRAWAPNTTNPCLLFKSLYVPQKIDKTIHLKQRSEFQKKHSSTLRYLLTNFIYIFSIMI